MPRSSSASSMSSCANGRCSAEVWGRLSTRRSWWMILPSSARQATAWRHLRSETQSSTPSTRVPDSRRGVTLSPFRFATSPRCRKTLSPFAWARGWPEWRRCGCFKAQAWSAAVPSWTFAHLPPSVLIQSRNSRSRRASGRSFGVPALSFCTGQSSAAIPKWWWQSQPWCIKARLWTCLSRWVTSRSCLSPGTRQRSPSLWTASQRKPRRLCPRTRRQLPSPCLFPYRPVRTRQLSASLQTTTALKRPGSLRSRLCRSQRRRL
mmetsp:Transcript_14304/g.33853  ORF Transcript_14304/g.33853 Transcript_14304/m.33853 type:complete len:263 (+) Transcript_14304:951-1739(+)